VKRAARAAFVDWQITTELRIQEEERESKKIRKRQKEERTRRHALCTLDHRAAGRITVSHYLAAASGDDRAGARHDVAEGPSWRWMATSSGKNCFT